MTAPSDQILGDGTVHRYPDDASPGDACWCGAARMSDDDFDDDYPEEDS